MLVKWIFLLGEQNLFWKYNKKAQQHPSKRFEADSKVVTLTTPLSQLFFFALINIARTYLK
jgi:hypothetical protein